MLSQSAEPMFLHEIRAALDAKFGSAPRPYKSDVDLFTGIMELVSDGQLTTVGPAYFFKKR